MSNKAPCAIIIVTYKRHELLRTLLDSIQNQSPLPDLVFIIDNNGCARSTASYYAKILPILYHAMPYNAGGSGGFSQGVKMAFEAGAEWFWLMDDDTRLLPHALEKMSKWQKHFFCFHGRRLNSDGSSYDFQSRLNNFLAMPIPHYGAVFKNKDYFTTNLGSFEGMMIHRSLIEKIGWPDSRFFISWDDAIYGWLASMHESVAVVNDYVIERTKPEKNVNILGYRVARVSNLYRYYLMRNRSVVKQYFQQYNKFSSVGFRLGTCAIFMREMLRGTLTGEPVATFCSLSKGIVNQHAIIDKP